MIGYGHEQAVIQRIVDGESIGSLLAARKGKIAARKQWLGGHTHCVGELVLDEGAVKVLQQSGASLLPIGVKQLHGDFKRGEVVSCRAPDGREIARGLINYPAEDARKIIGQPSNEIARILGYQDEPELVHRDNLILLN